MIRFAVPLALLLGVLSSGTASANLIRDEHACDPAPPPPVEQASLQEILDDLVVSGPPIDANAPSGFEIFEPSSSPMTSQMVFTIPREGLNMAFGIYDADDPGSKVWLFSTPFTIGASMTVSFLADGQISVSNGYHSRTFGGIDGPFGFFVKTWEDHQEAVFVFTDADLNGGETRAKVFQGNDQTRLELPGLRPGLFLESQFLIAWELGLGSENDGAFDDLLASVSAITPLPEPGALALVGIAVVALARMRRARGY